MSKPRKLAEQLKGIRERRKRLKTEGANDRVPRAALNAAQRSEVLKKTGGRCHLCGGKIRNKKWSADHVVAHSTGGKHGEDNYLPAHSLCNNYRWNYLPREFKLILKLGVWARTQIERETKVGNQIAEAFQKHEVRRRKRRRGP